MRRHGIAARPHAEKGKTAFIQHGCWQCHDFDGQGSVATSNGRVIARTAIAARCVHLLRAHDQRRHAAVPAGGLRDEELDDIYAYLQSLPEPKAASDIPLLNNARSQ